MVICFKCSTETKKALDSLVEHEFYKDYAEAISTAVLNLAVLQEELSQEGAVIIESDESELSQIVRSGKDERHVQESFHRVNKPIEKKKSRFTTLQANEPVHIPKVFCLESGGAPPKLAGLPDDGMSMGKKVPLEQWIFGQYNKLLPAKASSRALAHLQNSEEEGILLTEAASKISEEAAILGNFLAHHDKQNEIQRDNALSTAFPTTSPDAEKGRLRYASHFVASANKQGRVSGLLIDLKLINHTAEENPRLMLTETGWIFATLQNPVLDGLQDEATQKFTLEEATFLLQHIATSVPAEDFAYRVILQAITEGANTPDKIDSALQKFASPDANRRLSRSFFSTQRSGAISRMADLGLVARVRDGVRVSYVVTTRGQEFMGRRT